MAVCEWCGQSFEAPARRGPAPRYCRPSHRQRAYEARRAQVEPVGPADPVTVAGTPVSSGPLTWARIDRGDLGEVVARARLAAASRPSMLRSAVNELEVSLRAVIETAGLPVADSTEADQVLTAVRRAGVAIGRAKTTVADNGRSAPRLDEARQELLSVAAGILEPRTAAAAAPSPVLPVLVPGPAGELPVGLVGCDIEGRREQRTVRWYPEDSGGDDPLLSVVAGRAQPWRYDLGARDGWSNLAHDIIVIVCGYRQHAPTLPLLLANHATGWMAAELGRRFRTGAWALRSVDILTTLTRAGFITTLHGTAPDEPRR